MGLNDNQSRRLGLFSVCLTAVWVTLGLYVVQPLLPYSPVRLPYAEALRTQFWAPQGWAFFTRSPREARTYVFTRHDGQWSSAALTPVSRPSNDFGLSRAARAQGIELGMLLMASPPSEWQPCDTALLVCLDHASIMGTVKNASPRPTLCGVVGLTHQEPLPWAWRRSRTTINMPASIVVLEVQC
jgi:antimicrobial peptide system SdpA family protein